LPDWYLDEPLIHPVNYFFIKAFYDLSSCRNNGMGIGEIPWTAIKLYADHFGFEFDLTESLIDIIREMDGAYISYQNDQIKRNRSSK
jgi:hypothetical protein